MKTNSGILGKEHEKTLEIIAKNTQHLLRKIDLEINYALAADTFVTLFLDSLKHSIKIERERREASIEFSGFVKAKGVFYAKKNVSYEEDKIPFYIRLGIDEFDGNNDYIFSINHLTIGNKENSKFFIYPKVKSFDDFQKTKMMKAYWDAVNG